VVDGVESFFLIQKHRSSNPLFDVANVDDVTHNENIAVYRSPGDAIGLMRMYDFSDNVSKAIGKSLGNFFFNSPCIARSSDVNFPPAAGLSSSVLGRVLLYGS